MRRLITILSGFLCFITLHAQNKEVWKGELAVGQQKLPLTFHIQRGDKPSATLDSPSQNAYGIPATVLYLTNDSISLSIPVIGGGFSGHVSSGTINGTFRQNGYTFPLVLMLSEGSQQQGPTRPQTPKGPLPYATREVTFSGSDGYVFHGTLTLPASSDTGRKVKGVVLVSGSGVQNRDEELMGHKPFEVIADYLARNGVATLRYDDRGWDKTQAPGAITVQSNTDDAASAVKWLRQCNGIGSVGIIGHSEGGIIGYALGASTGEQCPDFVVSLAGPLLKGDTLLVAQNRAILTASGLDTLTVNQYCTLLPEALALMGRRNLQPLEQRIENLSPHMDAQLIENLYSIARTDDPWLRSFVAYDPVPALKSLSVPTMIFIGKRDVQVPWKENEAAFRGLGNPNLCLTAGETHNHLFQHCDNGLPSHYGELTETIGTDILEAILAFILKY